MITSPYFHFRVLHQNGNAQWCYLYVICGVTYLYVSCILAILEFIPHDMIMGLFFIWCNLIELDKCNKIWLGTLYVKEVKNYKCVHLYLCVSCSTNMQSLYLAIHIRSSPKDSFIKLVLSKSIWPKKEVQN